MKLQSKMRFLLLGIMVSCLLFCFITFYFVMGSKMAADVADKEQENRVTIEQNLDKSIDTLNSISHSLMQQPGVVAYLRANTANSSDAKDAIQGIYSIVNTFSVHCYVTIFRYDTEYINTGESIIYIDKGKAFSQSWAGRMEKAQGGYILISNGDSAFYLASTRLISFARIINDQNTQKPIGMMVINVPASYLSESYHMLSDANTHFAYYDEDGNVLATDSKVTFAPKTRSTVCQEESDIEKGFSAETMVKRKKVPGTDLYLATFYKADIWSGLSLTIAIMVGMEILLIIASMWVINRYLAKQVISPIHKLARSMDEVQNGWLHRVSAQVPNDEIGQLKDSYNTMLVEINHLIEKTVQQEKELQQAELDVLREQIKPHFLYNTLDTIRFMALEGDNEHVYVMLETLGNFYRRFLSKGKVNISLGEEIDIVKNYLLLQKSRYIDVFLDEYEIQDGIENIQIPRLILQPLVENSIYHGVRLKGETGIIKVTAYVDEGTLIIKVYDTGVGMDQDEIDNLLEKEQSGSFGLKGTIERIRYYYKQEDVYVIRSEKGKYCEVELRLPIR